MIVSSPVFTLNSVVWCLSLSILMTVTMRRTFTHDSIEWGERYRPFMGPFTTVLSVMILFMAAGLLTGTVFPAMTDETHTETIRLELIRLLIPLLVFYTLLWCLVPVLRKHFHPAFCAGCWILPNIVYFVFLYTISPFDGLVIVPVTSSVLKIISLIWLAGFSAVMLYRTVSHLRFRKVLTASGCEITDERILGIYRKLLKEFRCQKTYRLAVNASLNTPLAVGLEERSTIIFLPEREYTDEQLELILRHELIHIQRRDPYIKFFMSLVSAAGWFIPFTWMTGSKAAQDLELSCDQTVIRKCDEAQKKEYASLILSSSCGEKGFTTCLAAEAEDLQYRLREIMKPEKKNYGTVLIFLICFLILSCYGTVSAAEDCGSLKEIITESQGDNETVRVLSFSENDAPVAVTDEEGLYAYFSSAKLLRIPRMSAVFLQAQTDKNRQIRASIRYGNETYDILVSGRTCRVSGGQFSEPELFLLKEPFDTVRLKPFVQ